MQDASVYVAPSKSVPPAKARGEQASGGADAIQRKLRGATFAEGEAMLAPARGDASAEGHSGAGGAKGVQMRGKRRGNKVAASGAGTAAVGGQAAASMASEVEPATDTPASEVAPATDTPASEVAPATDTPASEVAPASTSGGAVSSGGGASQQASASTTSGATTAPSPGPQPAAAGRSAWRNELKRLVGTLPADTTDPKKVQGKGKWSDFAATHFAQDEAALAAGGFDLAETQADIAAKASAREAAFKIAALKEAQRIKGGQLPIKAQFWQKMGWGIRGKEWDMKRLAALPSGKHCHLTASGDSIVAPQTAAATDPDLLYRSPDAIFATLFMAVDIASRVHVTRELPGQTGNHVYLGDANGAGAPVADDWFGGDAQTMKQHLAAFRTDAIARIAAAQAGGWVAG